MRYNGRESLVSKQRGVGTVGEEGAVVIIGQMLGEGGGRQLSRICRTGPKPPPDN